MMRLPSKIIVHLVCLFLGAGFGLVLDSNKVAEAGNSPPQAPPQKSARNPRTSTPIKDRLQAIIVQEVQSRAAITGVTVREQALQRIERIPLQRAQNRTQYESWLLAAKRFERTSDLGPELIHALSADDQDRIGSVMVAWFLRDPSEAFDQFRLRPALIRTIYESSPLWHAVSLLQIKGFLDESAMPKFVRESVLEGYVSHLADFGKLAGFLDLLSHLEGYQARKMASHFKDAWLPVDPSSSASVIHRHLESPSMDLLLELMLEGFPNPLPLWTEPFGQALLAKPLGPLEPRRPEILRELERIDKPLGDEFYFQRDDAEVLEHANLPSSMHQVVKIHLNHEAGWEDRFVEGECGIREIEAMLVARIPESFDHPQTFHQALLQALWLHQPDETITWARERMKEHEIAAALSELLADLRDPRASRRAVLLESLEGLEFTEKEAIDWIDSARSAVGRWRNQKSMREASEK